MISVALFPQVAEKGVLQGPCHRFETEKNWKNGFKNEKGVWDPLLIRRPD
jgi:hypothetical protein